jgi:hypothetical protein
MDELEGMDVTPETGLFQYMVNAGFTPEAAAGILGNVYVETGPKQRYKAEAKQVRGPGRGLFQMEGNTLKAYNKWLEKNERTNSSLAQIDFMKETIYGDQQSLIGRGNARKLRESLESGDPTVAATAFANLWERPNVNRNPKYDERTTKAQQLYSMFTSPPKPQQFAQSDDPFVRMAQSSGTMMDAGMEGTGPIPVAQQQVDEEAANWDRLRAQLEQETGIYRTPMGAAPEGYRVAAKDDDLFFNKLLRRFWD